jgi:outer membrane protein
MVSASGGNFFELPEQINIIGIAIGQAPDYFGSDDYDTVAAPMGRYYFSGNQYVQVLGPQVTLNLLKGDRWQFGPELIYRFGRDNDVDDVVVKQMNIIDDTLMVGAFINYSILDPQNNLKRWVFNADIVADTGSENSGVFGTAMVRYWFPAGPALMNISAGISFASDDYNDTYYGVSGSDVALFPSLGGSRYQADGGINSARFVVGGVMPLSKKWSVVAGALYESLMGDAEDSPVVSERGDSDQWLYGIALGYTW